MQKNLCALFVLGVLVLAGPVQGDEAEKTGVLDEAVRKAAAMKGYAFQIEERQGKGAFATIQGKFEKGKPAFFLADRIEFFKKGDALAYKDGGSWHRSRTGTLSDPLRILGGAAKVRGASLPHEELSKLAKGLKKVKNMKDKEPGSTVYAGIYSGELDKESAGKLAPKSYQPVATGGQGKVWVGVDGQVHKYSVQIRLQGRLGNAEIDGEWTRVVILSDRNTARVDVPQAAQKALE
jgi:hypothetical protein